MRIDVKFTIKRNIYHIICNSVSRRVLTFSEAATYELNAVRLRTDFYMRRSRKASTSGKICHLIKRCSILH